MIYYNIEFKEQTSSTFDLLCDVVYRPILPQMNHRTVDLEFKSGVIDFGKNKNSTRNITIRLGYDSDNELELRTRAREIAAWLNSSKWEKLIIGDEPDKYYLARVYNEIDLESFITIGECYVTFECQPFAYRVFDTGEDLTWEEANFPWVIADTPWLMSMAYTFTATKETSFVFNNPGTKEIDIYSPQGSKSLIKINGSWSTLSLSMNGKTLNYIEAGTGELVIDNIEMEIELNGINKLDAIEGDIDNFLSVIPGDNTITLSGTGLNITVILDFTPMWL